MHTEFLIPATDLFLDIVHVNSGEQIRVFLTTITAPAYPLSFTGSVKISNFQQYNVGSNNVLPILSDAVIPQSLVALNCYKCSPVHNCTCPKYMCTCIIL